MSKYRHALVTVAAIVAATVPAVLADPAARSLIAHHPALAAYLPLASALLVGLYHALVGTGAPAASSPPPSSSGQAASGGGNG